MVATALVTHRLTGSREVDARHFAHKYEAYMAFLEVFVRQVQSQKSGKPGLRQSDVNKMLEFKRKMIVWGSPTVIEEWNSLEEDDDERSDLEKLLHMDDVLRAVRRDLGHSDRALLRGSLLGLFLTPEARRDFLRAAKSRA